MARTRTRRALPLGLLSVIVLALALGAGQGAVAGTTHTRSPIAATAIEPAGDGLIAFTTNRTGDNEIEVMNADASGQVDLTDNPASDSDPAWSPDGTKIAFTSDRTGRRQVFVMNADGTQQQNLTNRVSSSDSLPAWSPNGTKIAFTSDRTGRRQVFVMSANGTHQTNLTNSGASDADPAWSPDGTKIAFTSDRTGRPQVFVMNPDGTEQANLTTDPGARDSQPAWAPDMGTRLLFTSTRAPDDEVSVVDAAGTSRFDLTHDPASDSTPAWQPLRAATVTPSPIQHVVVLFQENHTFDNVLGKLCVLDARCDGVTSGQIATGETIQLPPADDIVPEEPHGLQSQITGINGGLMNGFSKLFGCGASFHYACYQQYRPSQIPSLAALARAFVISDRTFEDGKMGSFGAHITVATTHLDGLVGTAPYHGTDGTGPGWGCDSKDDADWRPTVFDSIESVPTCVPARDGTGPYRPSPVPWVPTIMDRMDGAGLSWRLYTPKVGQGGYEWAVCPAFGECFYGAQRQDWVSTGRFVTDAANGTLPNLSLVMPARLDSQHNKTSMLQGDNYLARSVQAVMDGPDWSTTAIFITWDDCGCFYDHVVPPGDLGIRVPMVIVSPFAVPGFTDSNEAVYASMLAFTEHAFGLAPLSPIDADAYDYSDSFDYTQAPRPPIRLHTHRVPDWVIRWVQQHPFDEDDPT